MDRKSVPDFFEYRDTNLILKESNCIIICISTGTENNQNLKYNC